MSSGSLVLGNSHSGTTLQGYNWNNYLTGSGITYTSSNSALEQAGGNNAFYQVSDGLASQLKGTTQQGATYETVSQLLKKAK